MKNKQKNNLHPGKGAKKLLAQIRRGVMALAVIASSTMACFATEAATGGAFGSSKFATGTIALVNDIGKFLMALGPIAGGVAAAYFLIRRSMADETDGKMWMKRVIIAVCCGVGVLLVGSLITIITGYYK